MPVDVDEKRLRERLNSLQFSVTREGATEHPFTGACWDHHGNGVYRCVVCGEALFDSERKFDSHSGWPSFWDVADRSKLVLREDTTHGMVRTEVLCANCGSHLGHLFPDGPKPTGLRYCVNSAALEFDERPE